jgi:hypothetical protein
VSRPAPREPGDSDMTGRYVAALALELVIIVVLWILGRVYA